MLAQQMQRRSSTSRRPSTTWRACGSLVSKRSGTAGEIVLFIGSKTLQTCFPLLLLDATLVLRMYHNSLRHLNRHLNSRTAVCCSTHGRMIRNARFKRFLPSTSSVNLRSYWLPLIYSINEGLLYGRVTVVFEGSPEVAIHLHELQQHRQIVLAPLIVPAPGFSLSPLSSTLPTTCNMLTNTTDLPNLQLV